MTRLAGDRASRSRSARTGQARGGAARKGGRRRRGPGRPRADAAADPARDRLVRVAAGLFARHGYARTPTARIARAAGVSEGTLFHHFPTKRALLAEVGAREGERVIAVAFEGVDPTAPPPDPEALIGRLFAYAHAEPDAYRLFAMEGDRDDLASGFSAKRERVTAGIATALAAWSERGQLRPLDPALVADLLFALVDTAVRRLVLEERWSERDAWLRETARGVRGLLFAAEPPLAPPARPRGSP